MSDKNREEYHHSGESHFFFLQPKNIYKNGDNTENGIHLKKKYTHLFFLPLEFFLKDKFSSRVSDNLRHFPCHLHFPQVEKERLHSSFFKSEGISKTNFFLDVTILFSLCVDKKFYGASHDHFFLPTPPQLACIDTSISSEKKVRNKLNPWK